MDSSCSARALRHRRDLPESLLRAGRGEQVGTATSRGIRMESTRPGPHFRPAAAKVESQPRAHSALRPSQHPGGPARAAGGVAAGTAATTSPNRRAEVTTMAAFEASLVGLAV